MRKSVRWYLSVMLVVIACSIWAFMDDYNPQAVKQGASEITRDSRWNGIIAGNINSRGIKLQIDGKLEYKLRMGILGKDSAQHGYVVMDFGAVAVGTVTYGKVQTHGL